MDEHEKMLMSLRETLRTNLDKINKMNVNKKIKYIKMLSEKKHYNNAINKLNANKLKLTIQQLSVKKALLFGLNYIGTRNELFGCINDTNNIKDCLTNQFNYSSFNILTDKTNKKPTRQNIINELTSMLVNAKSGDNLFFLYSGHGTYTTDLNKDELDGRDELIIPLDAYNIKTCILDDELKKIITDKLKKDVKLFMLFDSCFSGTIMDLKYNYLVNNKSLVLNPKNSNTLGQVICISGCNDNQTSADTYVNLSNSNMYSGAMTYSFIKSINQLGKNISLNNLIVSMRNILKTEGYTQIPQLSSGTNIDINTPIINLF
jgi:hypothetical protein